MGLNVKAGNFALAAATGNQAITGLGFQPKLVIFWAFSIVVNGSTNELHMCHGAATSATARFVTSRGFLGGASNFNDVQFRSDRCLYWNEPSTDTEQMAADFVSMDADGFTINVLNVESATINYLAIGGTDFAAKVGIFDMNATTGNQAITGVGFLPKALMVMTGPYKTAETFSGLGCIATGYTVSTTSFVCMEHNLYQDANGASLAYTRLNSTRRFIETINQNGVYETRAEIVSMDADGFTVNVVDAPPAASRMGYIAFGGTDSCRYDLTVLTKPTAVGTQTVSGKNFGAFGVLLSSIGAAAVADTSLAVAKWGMGAADLNAGKTAAGFFEPNTSTSTANPAATQLSTRAYLTPGTTDGATLDEADVSAWNSDGYTLNWAKVDATASEVIAFSFGLPVPAQFVAAPAAVSTVIAPLTTAIQLNASVQSACTATADLTASGAVMVVNLAAAATITADLFINPAWVARALNDARITASLGTGIALAGAMRTACTVKADFTTFPVQPQTEIALVSTITARLSTAIRLQARAQSRAMISANLSTFKALQAAVTCGTTVLANLQAPSDLPGTLPFADWLASDYATRCILVEVVAQIDGVDTELYLSNRPYATRGFETPASTLYSAVLTGSVKVTEKIGLDSANTLTYGDLELNNLDGSLDDYLNYVWTNRSVKVYVGDASWFRSKFELIFDGVVSGIDSRQRDRLNLKLRDKLQRLNSPVSEVKLGGTGQDKDRLLPLTFGEPHNITPLLIDAATHTYRVHTMGVEQIVEVRDNGYPITVTKYEQNGTFRLNASPAGTITASVQGDQLGGTYANDAVSLITRLVKSFGRTSTQFTDAEIDQTEFAAFAAANQQNLGLYLADRANLLTTCQEIAKSVGAQLSISRAGRLQIKRINLDFSTVEAGIREIGVDEIYVGTLAISGVSEVAAAVKVGFAKNWTVQTNLNTGIIEGHKELYAQEWLTETVQDNAVAATYKLGIEPQQIDTSLITRADANAEAVRRLNIVSVPRTTYRFTGTASLTTLDLAQRVKLTYPRYGLASGKYGVVVSLTPDWMTGKVTVEVMI